MQLHFRKYQDQDFTYCNRLLEDNMSPYFTAIGIQWDPQRYQKELKKGKVQILYLDNHKVGFLHISEREQEYYVNTLQIDPTYRNRGLGSHMLAWIERTAKEAAKSTVSLSVFKENPAIGLYKRLGYQIAEDRVSKYLMKKTL